ncbi:MAG: 50S ribosomal protein L28 [Alphaproteobacteria bacterium]
MARRCSYTGKGVLMGNNVSHAHNRTRRRFMPNLHHGSFLSESLGETVRLRLSANAIRTIEARGGLDSFLLKVKDSALPKRIRRIKRRIAEARASGAASAREGA